ncbi:ATP-dependent Clp protease adaptor protein ClpS, putative [Plasmodium ovale wallikeri]|uniref:ATP-dependent Clp protease adaptor protein ClpS, putative n=1 Tax=Plasmodium ovale wallikeri TaxID=864142 RepID=A0A1A8ZWL3_PLAOA|nr:ATP-dependent Clp protease adaptor protein ClpS, putative [Plasmodium ovale wallikeri]SBT48266.1 ATP-dependent Clp protease adaptor protein ClpS, putative [Plasmodium ovale wallikeri]
MYQIYESHIFILLCISSALLFPLHGEVDAPCRNVRRNVVKEIKKENIREFYDEEKLKREKETTAWKVILYNDDIHNFTYVTDVIVKVIGQISKAKAHTITVEAHSTGQALILSTWKARAEKYCEGNASFGTFSVHVRIHLHKYIVAIHCDRRSSLYYAELQKNGLTVSIIHESQLKGKKNQDNTN